MVACPCCGCNTLTIPGSFEVCPVCYWEDDGQNDENADTVRGGPNSSLSLSEARQNYKQFGACERAMIQHVRKPLQHELPE